MIANSKQNAARKVVEFYYLTVNLKELIRSGWKQWNVQAERLESVAEHIYGTCMLAIAIDSEFDYNIDLKKVILMLTVHELEEIVISDITPFQGVTKEEKLEAGHNAVKKILSQLSKGYEYQDLIFEFDAHLTKESQFAFMCDKLEADLMSLYYDRDKTHTLDKVSDELKHNKAIIELSENGKKAMGECFYIYEQILDRLDFNFYEVLTCAWNDVN